MNWIKVIDRMPPRRDNYITISEEGGLGCNTYEPTKNNGFYSYSDDGGQVIYWLEIQANEMPEHYSLPNDDK